MLNRFVVVVACIVCLSPTKGAAQQAIGVAWNVPGQQSEAAEELRHFAALGISHLQVNQSLDSATWDLITELEFTVFGKLPVNFPITQTLANADSSFTQHINRLIDHYNERQSVKAIGLLSFGNWTNSQFRQTVGAFIREIKAATTKELYYITALSKSSAADSLFNFKLHSASAAKVDSSSTVQSFLYRPDPTHEMDLRPVKQLMEHSSISSSVVFFDSSWLYKMENEHPNFASTLQLYTTPSEAAFPLPKQSRQPHYSNNLIIIMLLLAWIVLAVAYNYNPVYRRSLLRYYSGHNFYVNDVMERHIRSMFAGTSILIQHGIAGGVILYCTVYTGFSALGIKAIDYYYPIFSIFGNSPISIFLVGGLLTISVEVIMILWLRLTNPKNAYLSQIVNLYPWPLQLNLIIATVVIGFYLAGSNPLAIYLPVILFAIIFIGSFIITAYDTGRRIQSKRKWYFAGTIGIYLVIITVLIGWFFISQKFQEVLELATSLP